MAHDPVSQRLFVVNADAGLVDVLDIADPTDPELIDTIVAAGSVNSVDVHDGAVAVASQADPAQDPGFVELFDAESNLLASVQVGALPGMLTFTPDGTKIVVANEGEPAGYCEGDAGDPEGSVSIIDVSGGAEYDSGRRPHGRLHGAQRSGRCVASCWGAHLRPGCHCRPGSRARDMAVDAAAATAWVSLQENNALAVVGLAQATVTDIIPLLSAPARFADSVPKHGPQRKSPPGGSTGTAPHLTCVGP
ncbi:MAG: hypothetical protein M3381_02735 [Actinomycetota bacterium]|nr:hypothetical protein [Actinomycetota bacterium]